MCLKKRPDLDNSTTSSYAVFNFHNTRNYCKNCKKICIIVLTFLLENNWKGTYEAVVGQNAFVPLFGDGLKIF